MLGCDLRLSEPEPGEAIDWRGAVLELAICARVRQSVRRLLLRGARQFRWRMTSCLPRDLAISPARRSSFCVRSITPADRSARHSSAGAGSIDAGEDIQSN